MNCEQAITKTLIDRHSKSMHQMCRYYCGRFLYFNVAAFAKLMLSKILLHLKGGYHWPQHNTTSPSKSETPPDDYQIINLF